MKAILQIIMGFIKLFPKLFANLFSFIPVIGVWIKYLPEIVELAHTIIELTKQGITELQIKRDIKRINKAFKNPNRQQASRDLNDIFRNN